VWWRDERTADCISTGPGQYKFEEQKATGLSYRNDNNYKQEIVRKPEEHLEGNDNKYET
jgi:hypothetical protein